MGGPVTARDPPAIARIASRSRSSLCGKSITVIRAIATSRAPTIAIAVPLASLHWTQYGTLELGAQAKPRRWGGVLGQHEQCEGSCWIAAISILSCRCRCARVAEVISLVDQPLGDDVTLCEDAGTVCAIEMAS